MNTHHNNAIRLAFVAAILLVLCGTVQAAWHEDWDYRTPIEIDGNAEDLTNYQINVTLQGTNPSSANYIDFDKVLANGVDIRITDSDQTTEIAFWIEDWNDTTKHATIWVKVPSIPVLGNTTVYVYYGNPDVDYFRLSVNSTIHNDYGLTYPMTYKFSIPSGSSNLKSYKRYSTSGSWSQITEKTSSDLFNGIDAVRFDYVNNTAYISVAFDNSSDEIHLKITDASDQTIGATYLNIPEYYDNREMAITSTWDDWSDNETGADHPCFSGGSDSQFSKLTDILTAKHIGHTVGVITSDWSWSGKYADGPPNYTNIQTKIDNSNGYLEIASHSRHHPADVPYDDYEDEIENSKQDIIANLSLPYNKGNMEYIYTYIAPNYAIINAVRSQANTSKYLVIRGGGDNEEDWATWCSDYGLWQTGYTTKSDCKVDCTCPNPLYDDLTDLNAAFDQARANNGIYHYHGHPGSKVGHSWQDFDDVNSIFNQHTDYIANKTYAWSAGIGYLYAYRYVAEGIVTISHGSSSGNDAFEFYNDFNDETPGLAPVKWTLTIPANTNIDIDDQIHYGSTGKSMRLYDNSGTEYPKAIRDFSSLSKLVVEFEMRSEDTDSRFASYVSSGDTPATHITFRDGCIKYYDTAYHTIQAYSTSTWYAVKLVIDCDSDTYDVYIDDVLKNESVAFRNSVASVNRLQFNSWTTDTNDNYIDDVIVRKHTATEPTPVTTSAFRGYDKIFTGITNTISLTDYVSYSAEPTISNLVDMIAYPSTVVNITTIELTTTASIVLDGEGATNLTVQMPNTALTYAATYDGSPCNNAACSFTQSAGELNFSLTLGSAHTIEITGEDGDNSTYATHLTATTPGTAGNSITTTDTCGNASFGAATLTGGSDSDSEWAGSDVPTGVDIWRDGAGMIAIVVLALLAGIVIVFLRDGGSGEGLTISPNVAIGLAVGLLVLVAIFGIAPIFGDKIDSVADLGRETYATGRLTFVLDGTTADGETVTIDATTLEFDRSADGVTAGRIAVNISDGTAATASQNLTAAINGNATLAAVVAARRDVAT